MKPTTVKQKSTENDWKSDSLYENRVVYAANNNNDVKEYGTFNFKIVCLSIERHQPEYVSDEVVVALGEKVSKAQALETLRHIIKIIES